MQRQAIMQKIRVMIVDDHLVVREGLKQLLEIEDDIEVVAEASDGLECLQLLQESSPDLIFMDVRMPGISGVETTRLACQKYPQIKVIMLTIYEDEQYVTEAIKAGAKAYVLKKVNRDELIKIIRDVMGDLAFLDPTVTATVFKEIRDTKRSLRKEGKARLTLRELEVLKYLVEGYTDRRIGESLYISEHTIRSHIRSIYRKLRVSSRAEVVAKAVRDRIINGAGLKS
jgi:DNA-binding NarL/FixJ family response regulator